MDFFYRPWKYGSPADHVVQPRSVSSAFCPTVAEVFEVKNILRDFHDLPIEIIDKIIDYAEYWPRTVATLQIPQSVRGETAGNRGQDAASNICVLRSLPLGYCANESRYVITPIEEYLHIRCVPRDHHASEAVQASTSDLLTQWTKLSKPRTRHPCRKIKFTIDSKDQGWGGDVHFHGSYSSSYTWFDVGLERLQAVYTSNSSPEVPLPDNFEEQFHLLPSGDEGHGDTMSCDIVTIDPPILEGGLNGPGRSFAHPFLPPSTRLQSNVLGKRPMGRHAITWSYDDSIDPSSSEGQDLEAHGRGSASGTGDFVRQLEVGDIITVWARARFPGWMNYVAGLDIEVYWAV